MRRQVFINDRGILGRDWLWAWLPILVVAICTFATVASIAFLTVGLWVWGAVSFVSWVIQ